MITKFLSKLKSILFKSSVSSEVPLKKAKKTIKKSKPSKAKSKTGDAKKVKKADAKKVNKGDAKKIIENLTSLPGVGAKSAKALYEAGFKTTKSVISADEKDLLAVQGVGVNLVKKLKNI